MVTDSEGIRQDAIVCLRLQCTGRCLLKQYPDASVDIRVRRTLAVIKVVKRLFRVIEGAVAVEGCGMVRANLFCQLLIDRRGIWICR